MAEPETNQHTVQGINGLWAQEREALNQECRRVLDENARLKWAITQMLQHLNGDNFRSQQMAAARSIGEKALSGRFGLIAPTGADLP